MSPARQSSVNIILCLVFLITLYALVLGDDGTLPRTTNGLIHGVCFNKELLLTISTISRSELTLDACRTECLKRKKCKSLNYDKKYPLCKLYDNNDIADSNKTCTGVVYVDISHLSRPDGYDSCLNNQTFENGYCVIKECPEPVPSPNGHYLGNLYQVGSKRLHVCNHGYKLAPHKNETNEIITCSAQSGNWEPEIHECLAGVRNTVPTMQVYDNFFPNLGGWKPDQLCPNSSYATAYTMKIQPFNPGNGWSPFPDNTALTAVRLTCKDQHGDVTGLVTSGQATCESGNWGDTMSCSTQGHYLTSFKIQYDNDGVAIQGKIVLDQTAINYITFRCRDFEGTDPEYEIAPPGNGHAGVWLSWSDSCPPNQAVCGIKTQVKDDKPDCQGLVDVKLQCCGVTYS